ncbi:unnamed protein product [Haemonchus placei]|uniref:Uncharacterized protein n=1 Tax=Haemonchus placei TaxID=6290 RepID=A0A3P7XKQ6_HAEPC|nr:unnamed protein product [Haemonchus placei]
MVLGSRRGTSIFDFFAAMAISRSPIAGTEFTVIASAVRRIGTRRAINAVRIRLVERISIKGHIIIISRVILSMNV